jgi:succinate dehydrogenase / fumarate reductase, membrane anchor subunit
LCLCLWFVASIIAHSGSDYALQRLDQDTAYHALHDPLTDRTISTFRAWPAADVHSGVRFKAIIAIRLGCYGLTVMGIIATLHIASPAAEPTEALPHFGCGP